MLLLDSACNARRVQCYAFIIFPRVKCLLVDSRNDMYFLRQSWKLTNKLFQASLDCIFTAFATLTLRGVRRRGLLHMSRPGQPGWLGFRDLASSLFSSDRNSICPNEKQGWPGYRISDFATDISVTGMNFFPIWTLQPGWPRHNIFW